MNSGEVNEHVETRSFAISCAEIDFRVQSIPYFIVGQQDTTCKNTVKNMTRQIEMHPYREALKKDLQQNEVFNRFSEKSQDMLSSVENVEIFEMREISPKTRCPFCLTYNAKGIAYGRCKYCLESTNTRWQANKDGLTHYRLHTV